MTAFAVAVDWFHLSMRMTGLGQFLKGLAHLDAERAAELQDGLQHTKWNLWHGKVKRASHWLRQIEWHMWHFASTYAKFCPLARLVGPMIPTWCACSNASSSVRLSPRLPSDWFCALKLDVWKCSAGVRRILPAFGFGHAPGGNPWSHIKVRKRDQITHNGFVQATLIRQPHPRLASVRSHTSRRVCAVAFTTEQIDPCFAAVVEGLDLREPLSRQDAAAIHAAMDIYAVLVFHNQHLTDEQHLSFSRGLGELEDASGPGTSVRLIAREDYRLPTTFADVSNLDKDQQVMALDDDRRLFAIGNRLWHSDSSFKVVPAKYSLLRALAIPSRGGNTEFADMRAAYDALDAAAQREAEDLTCEHSLMYSRLQLGFTDFTETERQNFKPVRQRLVRIHPSTGRKSLFLGAHAGQIVGWPTAEAMGYLRDLIEHATQRRFVYAHTWHVGDLVIWDNRRTMHRGRAFPQNEPRDMRRTTLVGEGPTVAQVI